MSQEFIADLHAHSTASDGNCTPAEVVQEARRIGLKAIALTDHDTLAGLDAALEAGKEYGITVICGTEISIRFNRPGFIGSLHYLLYFSSSLLYDSNFFTAINGILSLGRGHQLVADRVASINACFGPQGKLEHILNRPLAVEEIEVQGDNISRRHFAEALIHQHGLSRDKVNRLISNDSPAYIPSGIEMNLLQPLFELFSVIRVLAHPAAGSFPAPSIYREVLPPVETVESILPEFLSLGLDGIEIYYPGHIPEHIDQLKKWAKNYHLLVTGGSDFHDRANRPMGTAGINKSDLDVLLAHLS